jgi:hypothetical protein
MNNEFENVVINTVALATVIAVIVMKYRRKQVSSSAFGTAFLAYDQMLKNWGMLGDYGLIVGRTPGLPHYIVSNSQ